MCWSVIETMLESTLISSKRTQRSVRNVRVVYGFLGIIFMNDTAFCHCTVWPIGLAPPRRAAPRWQAAGGAAMGLTSGRPIDIINIHDVYGSAVYQAFCTNAWFPLPALKAKDVLYI